MPETRRVEFADRRLYRHPKDARDGEALAMDMPEHLAEKFAAHLRRKKDAKTERGRKMRLAEIETSL